MERDTVALHFVAAAVARLDRAARHRVLSCAGIPQALLRADNARVPAQSFAALWLAVSRELDDEFFGLDRRRMKVGSFALLCHAALGSPTLERALRQVLRGFNVFLDDVHGELSVQDQQAVLRIDNRIADPAARRFADETFLVMVHGLMCWLAGKRVPLLRADFGYPRPTHASEYTVMFSSTLHFDAPCTSVRFNARLLSSPVVQDQETLKAFLKTAPQSVFLKYKNEASFGHRIKRHLRGCVDQERWPVIGDVAAQFHMSTTTLRRRLEKESTHYQALKDDVRRDVAIHCLCTNEMSIPAIGAAVGFREASAFRRAFKGWTGLQPGEYRRRGAGAGPPAE